MGVVGGEAVTGGGAGDAPGIPCGGADIPPTGASVGGRRLAPSVPGPPLRNMLAPTSPCGISVSPGDFVPNDKPPPVTKPGSIGCPCGVPPCCPVSAKYCAARSD